MTKENVTIIFSKNRALQLDACIRTLLENCKDVLQTSDVNVLYMAEKMHKESYQTLYKGYTDINFVEEVDFKQDLLRLLQDKIGVLFVVDDTIFTDEFSLQDILSDLFDNGNSIGFTLRLGGNTNFCYPFNCGQNVPLLSPGGNNTGGCKYHWYNEPLDFGYPLEVSSSVYRVNDLLPFLKTGSFNNPNSLEAIMLNNVRKFVVSKPYLYCFEKSVAFANPLNRVQTYNNNRAENIDAEYLLNQFEEGSRIDVNPFKHFKSNAAHQFVPVDFVKLGE